MTPMEGRSLVGGGAFLLFLALLRAILFGISRPPMVAGPGEDRLQELLDEAEEEKKREDLADEPLEAGEVLDPNRAGAQDLDRLPGVGPSLAKAWIRYRDAEGGFRQAEDLLGVPGIGPATLEKLRPFLDFSRGAPLELRRREVRGPSVDLNRAAREELESLPGIGPALAARILESRSQDGPFLNPADLMRVPGIGPATLERLRGLVRVGR